MELDNMTINFLSIFSLISFFVTLAVVKYSKLFAHGILIDNDFSKPQAFHSEPVARAGGVSIFFLFLLFILFYFILFSVFLIDYLCIAVLFFSLGFLDDAKIRLNPNIRLFIMIIFLFFCINIFSIVIASSGLQFLNIWLENYIFQTCFVLLCFLFVINGANLIDGFNGLLAMHFLIINLMLLVINLINGHQDILIVLAGQTVIVFSFLLFNFPKAKLFLGDGGSYLIGALITINVVKTHEINADISPFFFAGILFYLFYEVFFSFIRKISMGLSPLLPDKNHLHMLVYRWLFNLKKIKDANYLTALFINLGYLLLLIPLFYFKYDGLFSRYWFFLLIFIYSFIYYRLYSFSKK
jgi:UDP-GlcNAc:undecaprenyl-phosphate GlcNAc-1-phosphate transferase